MKPQEVEALSFSRLARYGRMAIGRRAERFAMAGVSVNARDVQEEIEEYIYGADMSVARRIRRFGEQQRRKTRR